MKLKDRPNLKRDIALTITFKLAAIFLIWHLFFSHPVEKTLTPSKVSAHLLGDA